MDKATLTDHRLPSILRGEYRRQGTGRYDCQRPPHLWLSAIWSSIIFQLETNQSQNFPDPETTKQNVAYPHNAIHP